MTPRPIYRWKSFWLGISVLIFLGWAWVYSLYHDSGFSWQRVSHGASATVPMGHGIAAGQGSGMLFFVSGEDPFATIGFSYWNVPMMDFLDEIVPVFPPAVIPRDGGVAIAHWFILLLFLFPWSAFLAWRWRRMKRRASTDSSDPQRGTV